MRVSLLLIGVVMAGCGGQPNGQQPPVVQPVEQAPPVAKEPAWKTQWPHMQPPKLTRVYQGRNAAQWARQLNDADLLTGRDAMFAMYHLGEEADYYVMLAMRSPIGIVREHAAQAFHHVAPRVKHMKAVLLPELIKNLHDSEPAVRGSTAHHLVICGYPEAVPLIKEAMQRETTDYCKQAFTYALSKVK